MPPKKATPILQTIKKLSPKEFEQFVAEVYRREGYLVEQAGDGPPDNGYDLVLLREASVLVQCRHWLIKQVGESQVRELANAMQRVGATGGVCITTGTFTKRATALAISFAIELVDGARLTRRFSSGDSHAQDRRRAA